LIEGFLPADGFCFARKANEIKEFRAPALFGRLCGAGHEMHRNGKSAQNRANEKTAQGFGASFSGEPFFGAF